MKMVQKTKRSSFSGKFEGLKVLKQLISKCFSIEFLKMARIGTNGLNPYQKCSSSIFTVSNSIYVSFISYLKILLYNLGKKKLKNQAVPSVFNVPVLNDLINGEVGYCHIENCIHRNSEEHNIPIFR